MSVASKVFLPELFVELVRSPTQPEEGAPENVALFPPLENQSDSPQVQSFVRVCAHVRVNARERGTTCLFDSFLFLIRKL